MFLGGADKGGGGGKVSSGLVVILRKDCMELKCLMEIWRIHWVSYRNTWTVVYSLIVVDCFLALILTERRW